MPTRLPPALVEEMSIVPNENGPEFDDGTRTRVHANRAPYYAQRIKIKMLATDEFARKLVAFFNEQQAGMSDQPNVRPMVSRMLKVGDDD